eukprot:1149962-Pelagomonas_calceolata.AAC.4
MALTPWEHGSCCGLNQLLKWRSIGCRAKYLGKAEDVVHEEQHVLALIAEELSHSQTCGRQKAKHNEQKHSFSAHGAALMGKSEPVIEAVRNEAAECPMWQGAPPLYNL